MLRNILLAAAVLIGASSAIAQPAAVPANPDYTEGEVRKIDKAAGKITLRHGEIKNLDMPAMTMVFAAARPELLEPLKVGDKVRFRAANQGGAFTVTEIQLAK